MPATNAPRIGKPLIGLPACVREFDAMAVHTIGDKYVRAVALASEAMPVMLPSLGALTDVPGLLDRLDGLVMTGSPSNVHPTHYGEAATPLHAPHDEERDATALPLIRAAVARAIPLFCICRGMQELNVALGGSLHPAVHELPGRLSHRSPKDPDHDVNYAPRHEVELKPGGLLAELAGRERVAVNSLHLQAIERLAPGLEVEARASDGTIEAVSLPGAPGFLLGVQWHPEYKVMQDPLSVALFRAFGEAARARLAARAAAKEAVRPGLAAPDRARA